MESTTNTTSPAPFKCIAPPKKKKNKNNTTEKEQNPNYNVPKFIKFFDINNNNNKIQNILLFDASGSQNSSMRYLINPLYFLYYPLFF